MDLLELRTHGECSGTTAVFCGSVFCGTEKCVCVCVYNSAVKEEVVLKGSMVKEEK